MGRRSMTSAGKLVAGVVIAAVGIAALVPTVRDATIGAVLNAMHESSAAPDTPPPARRSGGPLRVSTFTVIPAPFAETISATGTVRAAEGVELQAETNGKIVSINFREGSPVRRGELLVKLNDSDLRANLARYNYSKQLAETRFRRFSQLREQKVITQDEYDSALNEVNVQQAFIDLYRAQIEKTEIRAPFDGVVGLRYVSEGAYVNAQTRIATFQRLDQLNIDFPVAEKYARRIMVGRPISFTVAGGGRTYTGMIDALDPLIDSGTRTLMVRAIYANEDRSLVPGAFANIALQLEQLVDAVLIPSEAVIPGLEEKVVFVVNDGVAERRAVEIGARTASQVHVLTGLKAGDHVIVSGLQQVRAGLPVEELSSDAFNIPATAGSPPAAMSSLLSPATMIADGAHQP